MFALRGNIVRFKGLTSTLELLTDSVIGVERSTGSILFVEPASSLDSLKTQYKLDESSIKQLGPQQFVMPGLIDGHAHAPQYCNCGVGTDRPLLEWLTHYTFPTETKFKDVEYARKEYNKVVRRQLRNGTTTCVYFASIHKPASIALAEICKQYGQRAFVGKVNMDRNSPDHYVETTEQSLQDTEEFIQHVLAHQAPLVQPIVTPRFTPTCSPALMRGLGDLIAKYNVAAQSHVSENRNEVAWVKELEPDAKNYVDAYARYGFCTPKSILAHGIYLSDEEHAVLKQTGTSIIHCPNSNYSILSGICNVRRLLNNGVNVGMGTDISGGTQPSMLDAIRVGTYATRSIAFEHPEFEPLTIVDLLHLATVGNAKAVGLEKVTGNLLPGLQFDALVCDLAAENSPLDARETDTLAEMFQRFLFTADDRNIAEVFVAGRSVFPFAPESEASQSAKRVKTDE